MLKPPNVQHGDVQGIEGIQTIKNAAWGPTVSISEAVCGSVCCKPLSESRMLSILKFQIFIILSATCSQLAQISKLDERNAYPQLQLWDRSCVGWVYDIIRGCSHDPIECSGWSGDMPPTKLKESRTFSNFMERYMG